jgi:hypothetical protein
MGKAFQWESDGWEAKASIRSISQTFWGVMFSVSSHLYDFGNFEAVEWVPCVAAVNGACCS